MLLSAGWWPRLGSRGILRPGFFGALALPWFSEVRPRGILARERSLRLRMPRLPPLCPAPWPQPTAVSGAELPGWQPRVVQVASGNQSSHGPLSLGCPQSLSLGQWTSWPVAGKQSEPKDVARQKDSLSGAPKWAVMKG